MNEKQIKSFDAMANNDVFWCWRADVLLKTAGILRRERERATPSVQEQKCPQKLAAEYLTEEVEWMLTAFGIECLLKALYVKSGHIIAKDGKYSNPLDKGHKLVKLAKQVMGENNIPNNLQAALQKLTNVAVLGRYPTALDYEKLKFFEQENTIGYDNSPISDDKKDDEQSLSVLITDDELSLIDIFIRELSGKPEQAT